MLTKDVGRGEIRNQERYKQLISYKGMVRHRNITPTDIDTFIDYNGNAFVYGDAKLIGEKISYGQKTAFENIANSHNNSGRPTIVFVYRHSTPPEEEIIAANCIVSEIYWRDKWHYGEFGTLIECVTKFEFFCKNKNINL
jgi:hypothetical protein